MRRIRPVGKNCSAWLATIVLAVLPLKGQTAEPILTKTAIPFNVDTGAVKLDYAGGFGKQGASSQVIPEGTLEVGVYRRLEGLVRFPLLSGDQAISEPICRRRGPACCGRQIPRRGRPGSDLCDRVAVRCGGADWRQQTCRERYPAHAGDPGGFPPVPQRSVLFQYHAGPLRHRLKPRTHVFRIFQRGHLVRYPPPCTCV
jgi:hypothetical protein